MECAIGEAECRGGCKYHAWVAKVMAVGLDTTKIGLPEVRRMLSVRPPTNASVGSTTLVKTGTMQRVRGKISLFFLHSICSLAQ